MKVLTAQDLDVIEAEIRKEFKHRRIERLGGPTETGVEFQRVIFQLLDEARRLHNEVNRPEVDDFLKAVMIEAAHQRDRWGAAHDEGKTPQDWFWLLGYLAGKVLHPDTDGPKRRHRIVATAAVCANWFIHELGFDKRMRPGIQKPEGE